MWNHHRQSLQTPNVHTSSGRGDIERMNFGASLGSTCTVVAPLRSLGCLTTSKRSMAGVNYITNPNSPMKLSMCWTEVRITIVYPAGQSSWTISNWCQTTQAHFDAFASYLCLPAPPPMAFKCVGSFHRLANETCLIFQYLAWLPGKQSSSEDLTQKIGTEDWRGLFIISFCVPSCTFNYKILDSYIFTQIPSCELKIFLINPSLHQRIHAAHFDK